MARTPSVEPASFYKDLPNGEMRGVEAIKYAHRVIRMNLLDAAGGDEAAQTAITVALDMLTMIRPDMTREQVLLAAARRVVQDQP